MEIPSNKTQKETFWETALGRVHSTLTRKLLFSLTSILTQFVVCQLRDTRERFEAYSEERSIFRYIQERRFPWSYFVTCALHSQSYTFLLTEDRGIPFGE